jgi:hypothetical protein
MTELNLVTLGASKLVNGVPVVQAVSALTDATDDTEQYGEIDVVSQLGVSSCPAPADARGEAQGLICENVAGIKAMCVGARDTRNAAIYGNLKPGDTCVHATGPQGVSQCLLKAEKRQAILATKDTSDQQILVILDGKNNKLQIMAFGAMLELSKESGWSCVDDTGKGWRLQGGTMHVTAALHFGGMIANPAMALMMGPKTGSPGGPASVPLLAVPGVTFGV